MKTTFAIVSAYLLGIATLYAYNHLPEFSAKDSPDNLESELINAPLKQEAKDEFSEYQKNFENLSEVNVMGSLPPTYGDDINFGIPKDWQVATFSNSLAVGPKSIIDQLLQSQTPPTTSDLISTNSLPIIVESTKATPQEFLAIFAEVATSATQNQLTSQDLKTLYVITFNQDLQIATKGEKWHFLDMKSDTKTYRFILTDEKHLSIFKQILTSVTFD